MALLQSQLEGQLGQRKDIRVCQVCGRAAPPGTAHWLDKPHRYYPDINVIRCPEHWSEWALRHTVTGRTKTMRERMRVALLQPVNAFPPHLDPFPLLAREEVPGGI